MGQVPFEIDQKPRNSFVATETSDLAIVAGIPGGDKRFGTLLVVVSKSRKFEKSESGGTREHFRDFWRTFNLRCCDGGNSGPKLGEPIGAISIAPPLDTE